MIEKRKTLFLFFLFLLVFPKGGFKIASIPITWGYLLLGIAFLFSLGKGIFTATPKRIYAFLCTVPFQIVVTLSLLFLGVNEVGPALSLVLGFVFFPWMFFLFFSSFIDEIDPAYFFSLLKKGIFFIATYGIFLFFYKLFTGTFIEIPFLTINYHDAGNLELKNIDRGGFFKLISTYNNGNIYGICLLMLLPLYSFLETNRYKKSLVILSLILSFSRTVWIGLIFTYLMQKGTWLRSFAILFLIITAVFLAGFDQDFLFDTQLGGRIGQFDLQLSFFPHEPFHDLLEIVYLSILSSFGIIGLLTFLLSLLGPIFISLTHLPLFFVQRCILCGLMNYLLLSFSDGAILLIPVLAFYWILSSLSLRDSHAWSN